MRRPALNALATVSLAALVSVATSSQAVTPASLGALKQLDKWRVGIVDPEGQSFCAMVNKFDSNVGLAFALSPDGYGSVAIDVSTSQFAPGETYQVSLSANGVKAGTYAGRATSPRSVVVQVGQNMKFYDALKSNAALGVGLPQLEAEFKLTKFAPSYRQLVDCAATLSTGVSGKDGKMPAVKVKSVEKAVLAPLDRELADISTGKSADFAIGKSAEGKSADKAAAFDDVETSLETEGTQLASAETKKPAVTAEIGGQKAKEETAKEQIAKEQIAWDEPAQRVMLASTKTPSIAVPPAADSGATAKLWDESQAQAKQSAAETQAAETKAIERASAARIAVLEAVKNETAKQQVADFSQQKLALDTKVVTLQKQVQVTATARTAAPADKALKASLVAKQAEIARITAERARQTQELTQKLAATQNTYQSQITSVASERDALKKQLAAAQSESEYNKVRAAQLEGKLKSVSATQSQLSSEAEYNKARATQLEGKLKTAAVAQSQLSADRQKMEALEARSAFLESKLNSISSQARQSAADKAKLQALEARSAQLQGQLAAVSTTQTKQSAAEKARLQQFETKLAQSEQERLSLESQLNTVSRQTKLLGATLGQKQKQLETSAASTREIDAIKAETARMQAGNAAIVEKLQKQLADQKAQYDGLQNEYGSLRQQAQSASKADAGLAKQLSSKEAHVSGLERKIAALEAERNAVAASAQRAQADLVLARRDSSSARKSLIIINDDELPPSLTKKQPAVEEAGELKKKLAIARSDAEFNKARALMLETRLRTASATQGQADVSTDQQKIQELEARAASLEQQLNATTTSAQAGQPSVEQEQAINDQRAKLEAAHAEIARLKEGNAGLAEKLRETASAEPRTMTIDPVTANELASYRQRVVELEARLSEAQTAQRALPAPVVRRPSLVRVTADVVPPQFASVVSSPRPTRKPVMTAAAELAEAPAEVDVTQEILDMEPAAGGEDARVPVLSRKLIENAGSIRHTPGPALREVAVAPVARFAVAAPVTTAAPVRDPEFNSNRASAFLDRIMSHHRPPGGVKKAPAQAEDTTPVFSPARKAAPARFIARAPVVAAPVMRAPAPERGLSAIETAAGPAEPVQAAPLRGYSAKQQPVPAPEVVDVVEEDIPAPIVATPSPEAAPATPGKSGIENLLARAGIHDAAFTAAGHESGNAIVRQWTTGGISGMYEQLPAQGSLAGNAASYIERYREDCPALEVSMGAPERTAAGTHTVAAISCPTAGNSYSTSFVFWQDRQYFSAVLHSGYPTDAGKVRGIASSIVSALGGSTGRAAARPAGLSPRAEIRQAEAVTAPVAEDRPQMRFNIRQEPSAAYSGGASFGQRAFSPAPAQGDFATVVIE